MVPFGNTSKNVATALLTASRVGLEELNVHRHHASRIQVPLHRFEKFLGVEVRRTLHPRVQRIDGDAVEVFLRRQKIMTSIVDAHLHFRIVRGRRNSAR